MMIASLVEGNMEHGQIYYSIGALQSADGVERWTWTGDRYDLIRERMGIVYETRSEVVRVIQILKEYNGLV